MCVIYKSFTVRYNLVLGRKEKNLLAKRRKKESLRQEKGKCSAPENLKSSVTVYFLISNFAVF